jgi:SAM-dependent methyltransferase
MSDTIHPPDPDARAAGDPDTESPRVATHIIEHTRALALTTPPARGNPYFGLDDLEPLQFGLLAQLIASGIFRKYEFVLNLGSVLGGAARWLALGRGCSVVGITATAGQAIAANLLTRRANLSAQVTAVPADPTRPPFPNEQFTHVWSVDTLFREIDLDRVCSAAFQAVRPGGFLFAQETVLVSAQTVTLAPCWHFRTIEAHVEALRRAGFTDVVAEDVSAFRHEPTVTVETARAGLERRIAEAEGPECAYLRTQHQHATLVDARRRGVLGTANFVAIRPAFQLRN